MEKTELASIEFSLQWESSYATHNDRSYVKKVDFWRDLFPQSLKEKLEILSPGATVTERYDAGVLVQPYDQWQIKTVKMNQLKNDLDKNITPVVGKFYPQGWAWKGLNCFQQNTIPFRVVDCHEELFIAETNHPLSRYPLTVSARLMEILQPPLRKGGECKDLAELITEGGPGMQIPYQWSGNKTYSPYPFTRRNNGEDSDFYKQARMIQHLDDSALSQVANLYSTLLTPGTKVLDLMSSCSSHLPDSHKACKVTGLGLNEEELLSNPNLSNHVVHDLNQDPTLPFADNSFDAVICTSSIEYLVQPLEVLAEIARITVPGGLFVTTFSDRWFPGKEIVPWAEMHRFERLGLVLDYYLKVKKFENVHTESIRGLPRPYTDRHIAQTRISDPIFAVWANICWP
jgi:SAM-dependent methyltransferase